MPRTDEQRAADEALTAAIEQVRAAYYPEDRGTSVLTEYLVIFAELSYDPDGDAETTVGLHPRDGDGPVYQQIGLAAWADSRLRRLISESD